MFAIFFRRCNIIRIRKGKAKTKAVIPKERINDQITTNEVRLIDQNGKQVGVVNIAKALDIATKASLDLVEISPKAKPPVCRILDFGKYYYEKVRKARDAKKKQHIVQIKEIKYGPNTEEHDYNFKKKNAVKFLKQHNKVKFTVRFRGRQNAHKNLGYDLLERIKLELKVICDVDSQPKAEKNYISMILAPKKDFDTLIEDFSLNVDSNIENKENENNE